MTALDLDPAMVQRAQRRQARYGTRVDIQLGDACDLPLADAAVDAVVDPTERTDLVTSGPFALVRNPIFTSALITFTGLALTTANVVALSGLVVVFAGIQMQVRGVEEPHLLAAHGQAYADYAARVGRFLPWIGRLRP